MNKLFTFCVCLFVILSLSKDLAVAASTNRTVAVDARTGVLTSSNTTFFSDNRASLTGALATASIRPVNFCGPTNQPAGLVFTNGNCVFIGTNQTGSASGLTTNAVNSLIDSNLSSRLPLIKLQNGNGSGLLSNVTATSLSLLTAPPASTNSTGFPGQFALDANYLYLCPATNTWRRTTLSTWDPE